MDAGAALVRTDGGVVDVVVSGNHSQIERSNVHFILNADAFGLLQVMQGVFHQFGEVIGQVTMGHACRDYRTVIRTPLNFQ